MQLQQHRLLILRVAAAPSTPPAAAAPRAAAAAPLSPPPAATATARQLRTNSSLIAANRETLSAFGINDRTSSTNKRKVGRLANVSEKHHLNKPRQRNDDLGANSLFVGGDTAISVRVH